MAWYSSIIPSGKRASGPVSTATPSSKRARRSSSSPSSSSNLSDDSSPPPSFDNTTFEFSSSSSSFDPPSTNNPQTSSSPQQQQQIPVEQRVTTPPTAPPEPHRSKSVGSLDNDNDNVVSSQQHDPTEYHTAMSAARERLRLADVLSAQSERNLIRARVEYDRSTLEVRNATTFVRGVERRWGVVDMCSCSSDDSSSSANSVDMGGIPPPSEHRPSRVDVVGGDTIMDGAIPQSDCCSQSTPEQCKVRQIEVSLAGEPLVNGQYRLYLRPSISTINKPACDSTQGCYSHSIHNSISSRNLPTGPIYIHTEGPFIIRSEYYDVFIFQRGGYGHKVRWCIGLVPCHLDARDNPSCERTIQCRSNDEVDQYDQFDRGWNFALAYIYYWMEVDAAACNGTIDSTCPMLNQNRGYGSPSPSWGVCHGVRPLPTLKDVSDGDTKCY